MKLAGVEDIVLSAIDATPYESLGFEIVTDHGPRIGPIGGVEAVLDHFAGRCDAVILMPCDVPNICADQILLLIDKLIADDSSVVIPRTAAGHFHPLCVVVRDGMAGNVSDAVKNGRRKVMNVWLENNASIIDFEDDSVFQNINTHADLKKWSETKPDLTDKVA
jgi:molybdopterin-guanine dinucleotide biosynthesis protein A